MTRWITALGIAVLVALTAAAPAREWIPISDTLDPSEATVRVIASDINETTIELEVPGMFFEAAGRALDGTPALEIPGSRRINHPGMPDLPTFTYLIAIPDLGGVELSVTTFDERVFADVDIDPTAPFRMEGEEGGPTLADAAVYGRSALYPAEAASISDPMIMRDMRIVQLRVNPARYNPVTRELLVAGRVTVTLDYTSGEEINPRTTARSYRSEAFEPIYRSLIANYDELPTRDVRRGSYLVIASDEFAAHVTDFITWKNRRGIETVLVPLSDIGASPSAQDVKDFIQNAYDTWDNPPDFVCLVGDRDDVPAWFHDGDVTDHPYTELEGADYLPEIMIGRMSVASAADAVVASLKPQVYERDCDAPSDDWYEHALMVAANCCGTPQPTTPRTTKLRVREMLMENAYTQVDTVFWSYSREGSRTQTEDIQGFINAGVSFVNYRGWGGSPGWYYPQFYTDHINQLSNDRMLPVMTSIVCGTGNFDASSDPCFGEAWIRYGTPFELKGGPAMIGPSEYWTHTKWNNAMDTGIYQGILSEGLEHFGQTLLRGKMEIYLNYPEYVDPGSSDPDGQNVDFYFNVYNLIGDPELVLRTERPGTILATHAASVPFGQNMLTVHVEDEIGNPIPGAEVTVWKGDEVYEVRTLSGGYNVDVPLGAATDGDAYVTVWATNMKPYLGDVSIDQQSEFVGWYSQTIDDDGSGASSGDGDGVVNPGETIELAVSLKNYGLLTATGVTAGFDGGPPRTGGEWVTIAPDQTAGYGTIVAGATASGSNPFVFTIDDGCPNGTEIGFEFRVTDGSRATSVSYARIVVGAPTLEYYSIAIGGDGILDPGETASLVVTLSNGGEMDATSVTGTLVGPSSGLLVPDDYGTYTSVLAGGFASNAGNPFQVQAEADVAVGHEFTMVLELSGDNGLSQFVLFPLTVGVPSSDDPVGPDDHGYYAYDNTDTAYDEVPTYSWVEIDPGYGGSGTDLGLADDQTVTVSLPFTFTYYGDDYTQIGICSNGWIGMGDTPSFHHEFRNWFIPGAPGPDAMIAGFWDDLDPGAGGKVLYRNMGDGRFVIEWSRVPTAYEPYAEETLEIILYDPAVYTTETGDGEILYQYHTISNTHATANYATVGIEDHPQTDGVLYTFANIYDDAAATLAGGRAIKFTTDPPDGHDSTDVPDETIVPRAVILAGNQPNPFNPLTTISYGVPSRTSVKLEVFDVTGRLVSTLLEGEIDAGYNNTVWDGTNAAGDRVASGVYFAKFSALGEEMSAKMVLLK